MDTPPIAEAYSKKAKKSMVAAFSFDPIRSSYHPIKNNQFPFTNQYIQYYFENPKFPPLSALAVRGNSERWNKDNVPAIQQAASLTSIFRSKL